MGVQRRLIELAELETIRWSCANCSASYEIPIPAKEYPNICFFCHEPVPNNKDALLETTIENLHRCKHAGLKLSFVVHDKV